MSKTSTVRVALAATALLAAGAAGATHPEGAVTIDAAALQAAGCFGKSSCALEAASIATVGGPLVQKSLNGATGFGVNGGPSGSEIDIGETLRVEFPAARPVLAIKVLFLYNGPEFGDRAEKASIVADGTTYTLSVRNDADNANAVWSGPGTVTRCGSTRASGTGCFLITDPFPGAVSKVEFQATAGGPPFSGPGSNDSDYAIGFIDLAAQTIVDLKDCADAAGCPVATVDGQVAFSLSSVQASNPGGSTDALVIRVRLPDCRYIPQACLDLLSPGGDTPASADAARAILIGLGVIKTLDPSGPSKLNPAAQMLNVKPLLPADVTALFDGSGTPPGGLPDLYLAPRWRGQAVNGHWFDGFFFRTDPDLVFEDAFEGLVDVSLLTGSELGCVADPGDLLEWDVITTVSELARSVGGRFVDTPINVGCVNPTKTSSTRLSLYSINLEVAPDTWGPTIKSWKPLVTANNDAVFARLVESLWKDLGEIRANYACKQADPAPSGGQAPLAAASCKTLASLWSQTNRKVQACVAATFKPVTGFALGICEHAREFVDDFGAALPATTSRPDPFNRLGELHARVEAFKHIWDTRFLPSIEAHGFCREWGSCPP